MQWVPSIPKFTGTELGPDLESWIKVVEDHPNAVPKLSPLERLIEAKTYLSAARPKKDENPNHISYLMPDPEFENLQTWTESKVLL